jgi:hypothetical protein
MQERLRGEVESLMQVRHNTQHTTHNKIWNPMWTKNNSTIE